MRPEHPSGRPIREFSERRLSILRPAPIEPHTIGLRRDKRTDAIGFWDFGAPVNETDDTEDRND